MGRKRGYRRNVKRVKTTETEPEGPRGAATDYQDQSEPGPTDTESTRTAPTAAQSTRPDYSATWSSRSSSTDSRPSKPGPTNTRSSRSTSSYQSTSLGSTSTSIRNRSRSSSTHGQSTRPGSTESQLVTPPGVSGAVPGAGRRDVPSTRPVPTDDQPTRPGSSSGSDGSCSASPGGLVPFSGAGHKLGQGQDAGNLTTGKRKFSLKRAASYHLFPRAQAHLSQELKDGKHMDADTKQTEFLEPLERRPLVYHMDSKKDPGAREEEEEEELPEDFFQVTAEDIKRRYAQLQTERRALEEAPLLTSALREDQVLQQIRRHPQVCIRVCFPDRHVLQGVFRPLDTVGTLKQFVRSHLADPRLEFCLYGAPGSLKMDDPNATLYETNLFPNALLYISSGSNTDCVLHPRNLTSVVPFAEADAAMKRGGIGPRAAEERR